MPDNDYVDRELKKHLERTLFARFYILCAGKRYEVTDRYQVACNENLLIVVHPQQGLQRLKKSEIAAIHQGSWDLSSDHASEFL